MLTTISLIILMSFLARAAGGGFPAQWLEKKLGYDGVPEMAFAVPFGLCLVSWPIWATFLIGWVWSLAWMETGHGTAYMMGRDPATAQSGRKQFLSPPVDWLCKVARQPLGGRFYCYAFMGLKGLLIGLPAAPWGLLLAVLWPVGYDAGRWLEARDFISKKIEWSELISGGCAGLVLGLALS